MALSDQQTDDAKRGPKVLTCEHLSVDYLTCAEKALLRYVQLHHFPEELSALKKGNTSVKRSSRLRKLNPVLDDGVLRVGGRLNKMAMPEEFKHPAILPKTCHLTKLLIRHAHISVGHG